MKKLIFLLPMLIFININAQDFARQSLEMGVGQNLYHDGLGTSRSSILVNAGYRYMFTPKFGLQGNWQFDVLRSKDHPGHPECEYRAYSQGFRIEMFRNIARIGRFSINGTAGFGGTYYWLRDNLKERVFNYTAAGNVLYSLGQKKNPWGFVGLEFRGTANTTQEKTLNSNFDATGNPIQAFKQDFVLRVGIYLDNGRRKPHVDWGEVPVSVKSLEKETTKKEDCCQQNVNITSTTYSIKEIVPVPVAEHIFFDFDSNEIKPRSRNASEKVTLFAKQNPQYDIVLEGWSCLSSESYYNRVELPKKRTAIMKALLISKGVEASRIIESPQGIDRTQVEEINHAFARRVDVKFIKRKS